MRNGGFVMSMRELQVLHCTIMASSGLGCLQSYSLTVGVQFQRGKDWAAEKLTSKFVSVAMPNDQEIISDTRKILLPFQDTRRTLHWRHDLTRSESSP